MKQGRVALLLVGIISLGILAGCAKHSDKMWDTRYTEKGYTHPESQGKVAKPVTERHMLDESLDQVREVSYPGAKYGSGTRAGAMFGGY